jgi:hypothetical protein
MSAGQSTLTLRCKPILSKQTVPTYYPPYWQMEREGRGRIESEETGKEAANDSYRWDRKQSAPRQYRDLG